MSYSLGQAAKAVGKSKPTLARAIKRGQISATKAEDGSYAIDPAELHRIYPIASDANGNAQRSVPPDTPVALQGTLDHLQLLLGEREETIRDLRGRLDASEGERRQLAEDHRKLIAALTDRRAPSSSEPEQQPPAASWPRRVGRWLLRQHT
jgi:hypothetical protein